jgi:ABC-type antimicrobial peptide transport system permease subunit
MSRTNWVNNGDKIWLQNPSWPNRFFHSNAEASLSPIHVVDIMAAREVAKLLASQLAVVHYANCNKNATQKNDHLSSTSLLHLHRLNFAFPLVSPKFWHTVYL